MNQHSQAFIWLWLVLGLCLYTVSTLQQQNLISNTAPLLSSGLPPAAQQVLAGPFAGAAADFNILHVFSIYDAIRNQPENNILWQKLQHRLVAAQALDPWFRDTYRLTTGLLGFHQPDTASAVAILVKGAQARTWDWETPFIAAYLTHDLLHDDQRAYELMKESIGRPQAPSLAIGLAAQFLNASQGSNASIHFLQYLKSSMPSQYREVINDRIKRLQKTSSVGNNK